MLRPKIMCTGDTRILILWYQYLYLTSKLLCGAALPVQLFSVHTTFEEETPTDLKTDSRYAAMLQNYEIPVLYQRNALKDIFWMQNYSIAHAVKSVCRILQQHFGNHIIIRHFLFPWLLWSPYLTPRNFWFWGYIKSSVTCAVPKVTDLKDSIKHEIANILHSILHKVLLSTIAMSNCL